MTHEIEPKGGLPSSRQRRDFLKLAGTAGFTVAAVAAGAGILGVAPAEAQTRAEESEREAAAKYVMTIATAYRLGTTRTFPVMQLQLKENIQNATRGQVYVRLVPDGALGAGTELAGKVQNGTIQAGQHSMANFAPFAPTVDLINIPYWCGDNQQFVNLVTSDVWKKEVDAKVAQNGFKVLLYQPVDPRTISLRRGLRDQPVRTPEDIRGVKFRVPGSKILAQLYAMLGANPTPIAWGETPSALRQGVADALDPNVMGLNLFGFKDIVGFVTFARTVPDGGVYSCNQEWFDALDSDTKEAVEWGSHITFLQNLSQVPASREYAMNEMAGAGVQFYSPNEEEMAQWVEKAGAQRPEWDDVKKELVGSLALFDQLNEAAGTMSKYYVNDT
ncbi:MAG: TRAP transporter substrate-binding protein [Rhodobacteraceae bacterium]|nr:TRAP transporter substrate-binding protein [Paracoccaceae bacterium]